MDTSTDTGTDPGTATRGGEGTTDTAGATGTAATGATAVVDGVGDPGRALGAFLRARRGRVAPELVGLAGGGRRRVQGLRREELAQLAGISVDYYVRLEQGRSTQPSPEVLDALARTLGLDEAERRHLDTLASARRAPVPRPRVGTVLRRMLDALGADLPAFVTDHRLDVVAWNGPGAELIGGVGEVPRRDRNQARFLFLDPESRTVHPDWADRAAEAVGQLRVAAGTWPDDAELIALIRLLSSRSGDFRRIWDSGEVVMCAAGRKRLHHPATGVLTLDFEPLNIPAAPGQTGLVLHVFSAGEDAGTAAALTRLAAAGSGGGTGGGGGGAEQAD
ncbi:helix-turn-helix transcriptional regulator [Kitasatospora sp. NBC_00458]|uniref:helix-turn-helix transcriptional regulator n=1 Tax=Kitasatospora sp. NBC_00458 TaxID=2903568 RepID=UPI002E19B037